MQYGGKAKLTITLAVENKKGKIQVTDTSKLQVPAESIVSRFHVSKGGKLMRRDPNQGELDFTGGDSDEPIPVRPGDEHQAANDS